MEGKTNKMPYLNRGDQKGKKPRTTVWEKLLVCECGRTFNMRRWERSDHYNGNAYQCHSSVETGSYESRKKKGLSLDGICRSPMIPEWRLQMMANLIFRKYLSEKDKVLALANWQYALEQYTNRDEGQDVPESVIEAFVTKIVVSKDGFDWYLRFDGDPDDPLHCKIEGKRKNTTKIVVAGVSSPAIHRSATGRYQNWGGLSYISSFPSVSMRL